jgi:hypothetical protein
VRAQHDGCLFGSCNCNHLQVPLAVTVSMGFSNTLMLDLLRSQGVCHVADDLSGETLFAIWVNNGEGDGVGGVSSHSPVTPIPAECVNADQISLGCSITNQPSGPPWRVS